MSDKTAIEWTDATWNPTRGCTEIAPGCAHCYAKVFAERFRGVPGHPYERGFDPRLAPDKLGEPLKWKKPRRIFVDSMSDLFHEDFPDEYLDQCFAVMALASWHTFQVLTKRPERAAQYFAAGTFRDVRVADAAKAISTSTRPYTLPSEAVFEARRVARNEPWQLITWPLPNVHIGTSIANQIDADKNIPHLLKIPAAVRFLSIEPLIGAINLDPALCEIHGNEFETDAGCSECQANGYIGEMNDGCWLDPLNGGVSWVIVGGESGLGARPCDVAWIRSVVRQCQAAAVPVFVKQLGAKPTSSSDDDRRHVGDMNLPNNFRMILRDRKGGDWNEWPADLRVRQFPGDVSESEA